MHRLIWCYVMLFFIVTCQKQSIMFPSPINVAKGGCTNTAIGVGGLTSSLTLNIQPAANSSNFNVSSNQIVFTPQHSNASIVFCASRNISVQTVPITLSLTGPDSSNFNLLSPNIQANIIDASTALQQLNTNTLPSGINLNNLSSLISGLNIPTTVTTINSSTTTNSFINSQTSPSFLLTLLNTNKSAAQYNVITNGNGTIYYTVQAAVQSGQLIRQSPNDLMTWIYSSDRDLQLNYLTILQAGSTTLNISGLRPSETYTLCGYFENTLGAYSNPQCSVFNTTNELFQKTVFTFTRPITPTEMNKLLCFMTTTASLQPQLIVNIDGESCNTGGSTPTNFYYRYPGTTIYPIRQTFIYYVPTATSDTQSATRFGALFTSQSMNSQINTSVLSNAVSQGITFIDRGFYVGQINSINLQIPSNQLQTVLKIGGATNTGNGQILISNITSPLVSVLYMVTVPSTDPQPTSELILNCRNGNNQTVSNCSRTVLYTNETNSISVSGVSSNQNYKIYYVLSNEYPSRPIIASQVGALSVGAAPSTVADPAGGKSHYRMSVICVLALLVSLLMI